MQAYLTYSKSKGALSLFYQRPNKKPVIVFTSFLPIRQHIEHGPESGGLVEVSGCMAVEGV